MSDYGTMEAGREMDALVAEKVMGINPVFDAMTKRSGFVAKEYSTSISAAWEVVEKMVGSFMVTKDISKSIQERYRCVIPGPITVVIGAVLSYGDAPTSPLAICRAALKAVDR